MSRCSSRLKRGHVQDLVGLVLSQIYGATQTPESSRRRHHSDSRKHVMQEGRDPKLGFVATEVGASLEFRIDSTATTSAGTMVPLRLSYLASYEHMGKARAPRCSTASVNQRCHHEGSGGVPVRLATAGHRPNMGRPQVLNVHLYGQRPLST